MIEELLFYEKNEHVVLGLYVGLYLLGQKKYLEMILGMLDSKLYQVRCATANFLFENADEENLFVIRKALKEAFAREKNRGRQIIN